MIVPDVNLLLYAYDSTSPFHGPSRAWWERCLSGSEPVGMTHAVIFGFVRIGTNARAYLRPMSLTEASIHVSSWLSRQVTRVLHPDSGHVEMVLGLLKAASSAGGNLVTDAQIAALALAHKGTVHTADHDFERFKGLDCRFPLDD